MQTFRVNWASILFGAIGLAIGYFLNVYANKVSNQELLAQLKAELESIKNQSKTGKISPATQQRQTDLEGAIKILESKQ